jgi:tRNA pseudouridine55 synthase
MQIGTNQTDITNIRPLAADRNFLNETGKIAEDIEEYPEGIIIPVDKPYRWTSADVIRKIKFAACKHFHKKSIKIGHAGTLDPLATGILLVCIGKATKKAQELQSHDKEYIAGITFGATTPSYDQEKEIDRFFPVDNVSEKNLREKLPDFIGTGEQIAPLFSAKSSDGIRAYELARKMYRQGKGNLDATASEILQKSIITIKELELLDWKGGKGLKEISGKETLNGNKIEEPGNARNNRIKVTDNSNLGLPQASIRITCSKGTYIRALARDIGESMDSGAFLSSLRRTGNGEFSDKETISVQEALSLFSPVDKELRYYTVSGHTFGIELEKPWKFAPVPPEKEEIIKRGKEGLETGVEPLSADDEAALLKEKKDRGKTDQVREDYKLKFFRYEPFSSGEPENSKQSIFTITVKEKMPEWIPMTIYGKDTKIIIDNKDKAPYFTVYERNGEYFYEFKLLPDSRSGILRIFQDYSRGVFYPLAETDPYRTMYQINSSIMLMFMQNTACKGTLLMHASVIRHKGKANMFLGTSGTGKSTHSKLWLKNIEDCDLINDDNPVIRLNEDGSVRIFGTPWSGKTPCYRNTDAQLGAIVKLEQASENKIVKIAGIEAFAAILPSVSAIRWNRKVMDGITGTIEKAVTNVPCYNMGCLPDDEAARICCRTIYEDKL